MSAYSDTLAWLYGLEAARGMDFKLERVALALKALGEPQRRYPVLHIAGTNGKGSVAAMLHAMLRAAGRHAGLYTSPHLLSFTERVRVGDAEITEDEVVDLTREIQGAATLRGIDLTFFEFVTVMALLCFARHQVDCAVIEVGLGGRLDATNVIDPEVAIVTTIGRDHEQYLGSTIESIAAEKGGIIKAGRPVVLGRMPASAKRVLLGIARARSARVVEAEREMQYAESDGLRVRGLGWELNDVDLALRGQFQRENAMTALAAAGLVRKSFGISDEAARTGLANVRWPGRLEIVSAAPLVVVDGAHNEDGVAALIEELPQVVGGRRLHLLFAVMGDKRWQPMAERLGPLISSATIASVFPPRGELPQPVAAAFERYCPVDIVTDAAQAAAQMRRDLPADEALLVTGSLFLVGAVYAVLSDKPMRETLDPGLSGQVRP